MNEHDKQRSARLARAEWVQLKALVRALAEREVLVGSSLRWVCDEASCPDSLRVDDVQVDFLDRPAGSYRLCFGRPEQGGSPFDSPDKVVWTLEARSDADLFIWAVRELEATLPSSAVAELVVTKLLEYCRDYESSIQL